MFPAASYKIRERGPTPRGFYKVRRASSKKSWRETGERFASKHADRRFTHAHARLARYKKRTEKYERQKFKKFGHTYPLEHSGQTRLRVQQSVTTSTSHGARVRFPAARRLNTINRRAANPINMAEEFSRVPSSEADELAEFYDTRLDHHLNTNNDSSETVIA